MVQIATAAAACEDTQEAAAQCVAQLLQQGVSAPNYLMIQANTRHDLPTLAAQFLRRWPSVRLHAASSCLGSMTQTGLYLGDPPGVCCFALTDVHGDYGTACGPIDVQDVAASATRVIQSALMDADRLGESPAMVWVSSAPGHEEAVIAGIQSVVGAATPIVGGSAADNAIEGKWQVMANGSSVTQGVVVSVLFPASAIGAAFHSGYSPTQRSGRITRCDGRRVIEIDGAPAAQVYATWTGQALSVPQEGTVNVLMSTTLWPLGRRMETIGGADVYLLSHPETMSADGVMTLFTEVHEGDELVLMHGSLESLLSRPVQVAASAARVAEIAPQQCAGMILVFCAGCMLTVKDRMDEVRQALVAAMPGVPFITAFTFGEQGPALSCQNRHGNLMISAVLLAAE